MELEGTYKRWVGARIIGSTLDECIDLEEKCIVKEKIPP